MKKLEEQLPNPFPSLGTSASMGLFIKPIGYDDKIADIHDTINNNYSHQAMIFNIVGKFGYGKTLFLNYFKDYYKEDFYCVDYNLNKFESLGHFFLDNINEYENNHSDKKGLVFFIDETQNIFLEEKKKEKNQLLDFLRDFPDGRFLNNEGIKIEKLEILKKIIVFFAIHPETAQIIFFERQDVGDRCLTQRLDLQELDYYSSRKIIKIFMAQKRYDYLEYFEEGAINTVYVLTSFLTKQRHKLIQKNPRIFLEIFFKLFEYLRNEGINKLSIKELIDIILEEKISIGTANELENQAFLKLNNPNQYLKISNKIQESDKQVIDSYIFNPKWKLVEEGDRPYIEDYNFLFETNYGYFIQKDVFNELNSKIIDKKLQDQIRSVPRLRIFCDLSPNDDCFLIFERDFYGFKTNSIKEFFDNNNLKSGDFFRLRLEYLEMFFNYKDSRADSGLYDYLKSKNKTQFFFKKTLKEFESPNTDDPTIKQSQGSFSYKNLIGDTVRKQLHSIELSLFPFQNKWEKFNLYFITDLEFENINNIIGSIIENQHKDTNLCDIIILEPYINEQEVKIAYYQNPKYINKFRIFHPELDEFGILIGNNTKKINDLLTSYLIESRNLSVKELLEKNYIIPLTNLKIQNKQNIKMFQEIIETNFEYEEQTKFNLTKQEIEKPIININNFIIHDDDIGKEKGKETLKKFLKIENDEVTNENIFKPIISDYEINFLEILIQFLKNKNQLSIKKDILNQEIGFLVPVSERKYCKFSDFIPRILELKKIIKIEKDTSQKTSTSEKISLISPKEYLEEIIQNLDQVILFDLSEDEKKKYSIILDILKKDFLKDEIISINPFDLSYDLKDNKIEDTKKYLLKASSFNYICAKLEEDLNRRYIKFKDDLVLEIIKEIIKLNSLFEKTFEVNCPNSEKAIKLSYNSLMAQSFSSVHKQIADLINYTNNIKDFSKSYLDIYSKKILKILCFAYLYSSYYENEDFLKSENDNIDFLTEFSQKLTLILGNNEFLDLIENHKKNDKILNKIKNDYKNLLDIIERGIYFYYIGKSKNIDFKKIEFDEFPEWDLSDNLISMNLVKNFLDIIKKCVNYIDHKSDEFNDLKNNIENTLIKLRDFCVSTRFSDHQQYYFLYFLVQNNLIKTDEFVEDILKNINCSYVYFEIEKEIDIFSNLIDFNYIYSVFYLKFINYFLNLINQELNINYSQFKFINELKDNSLLFLNQLFENLILYLPKDQQEVINNKLSELPVIFKFIFLLYSLHNEITAKNFLYFKLSIKETFTEKAKNKNLEKSKNDKIKNEFYKSGLLIKTLVRKFKYNQDANKDVEISVNENFEDQNISNIIDFYKKIFSEKKFEDNLIEVYDSLEKYIPEYKIFNKYDKTTKSTTYFCPLNFDNDFFKINYFNQEQLEEAFKEVINKLKHVKLCNIIKTENDLYDQIEDNNTNIISSIFNHPLLELKELLETRNFGLKFDETDFFYKLIQEKVDQHDLEDIFQDLIDSEFDINRCFGKTKEFLDFYNFGIIDLKHFSDHYQNNLDKIKEKINEVYHNVKKNL